MLPWLSAILDFKIEIFNSRALQRHGLHHRALFVEISHTVAEISQFLL